MWRASGYGILHLSVVLVCRLVGVEYRQKILNDVASDQFLRTLHNDMNDSHGLEVLFSADGGLFLRQG